MSDELLARIAHDRAICGAEACIKGTRVLVRVILGHLAAGDSVERIVEAYPTVTADDVRACLACSSERADR